MGRCGAGRRFVAHLPLCFHILNMGVQDAYVSHIVSRIEADVQFLVDHGALSAADAQEISAKLAATGSATAQPSARVVASNGFQSVAAAFKRTVAPPQPPHTSTPHAAPVMPMPAPVVAHTPPPPAGPVMLRALWDWEDDNDLTFKTGDRIELVAETSPEWWTGRIGGRTGLFPANYVEKLPNEPPHLPTHHLPPAPTWKAGGAKDYYHQSAPPPAANSAEVAPPAEEKKSKFGGLGKTMAGAAAGGVGFGAGAAVGSGIINAIF
ncbi:SH3-domain-containing protein [Auriculariales sp. MPI-PUGE-AT-0066]|nr:SH3-domain-containing protein [Auriculariales sp. MPI-PUGE-AT-0066]